jgi:hypothetical protein
MSEWADWCDMRERNAQRIETDETPTAAQPEGREPDGEADAAKE